VVRLYMDPPAIIDRVKASEEPPFRPFVGERDCPPDLLELMEKCWSENPDDRPTFAYIRITIRSIMK
jgi:atrial natriuretic peptide receptor A